MTISFSFRALKTLLMLLAVSLMAGCSSNEDSADATPVNPTPNGRYKISFVGETDAEVLNYKVKYVFGNGLTRTVDYVDSQVVSGFETADAAQLVHFEIEMTKGECYFSAVTVKVEDLQTGQVMHQQYYDDYYLISPDMLTEFAYMQSIGYPQSSGVRNNYKMKFVGGLATGTYTHTYPQYDYRAEVLKHKVTRGSVRVVAHGSHSVNIGHIDRYMVRPTVEGVPYNYNLDYVRGAFSASTAKTYEFIIPSTDPTMVIQSNGAATVHLMRKDGTTYSVTIGGGGGQPSSATLYF